MKIEGMNVVPPVTKFSKIEVLKKDDNKGAIDSQKAIAAAVDNKKGNLQKVPESTISEEQLIEAIEHANKALTGADRRFEFSIHEGTKEIMVKVIDDETGEIVREIPPEKILDMVAKMWELAGILVDRKI